MKDCNSSGYRRGPTTCGLVVVGVLSMAFSANAAAKTKTVPSTRQDRRACADAFTRAKERAESAHLREAQDWLGKCARAVCGSFLQQACTTLYTQLEAEMPSIVPGVTDDAGQPHALVELRMDGELLTRTLDGHGISVDPGKHELVFSTDTGVFAKKKIMIVQGQRNRPISVVLHVGGKNAAPAAAVAASSGATTPEAAAEPMERAAVEPTAGKAAELETNPEPTAETQANQPEEAAPRAADAGEAAPRSTAPKVIARRERTSGGPAWLTYTLAGVGAAGIGGYVLLSVWGKKDNDMLTSSCGATQDCMPASVDHVHRLYLEANIAGAVGLASLAASAWLFFRTPSPPEATDRAASLRSKTKPTVSIQMLDVQPTQSGAVAMVGGAF